MANSQKNSAGRFGENYLTNHLAKFLQDRIKPWRVGALGISTGYEIFYKKIVIEGLKTLLYSRDSW